MLSELEYSRILSFNKLILWKKKILFFNQSVAFPSTMKNMLYDSFEEYLSKISLDGQNQHGGGAATHGTTRQQCTKEASRRFPDTFTHLPYQST